MKKPKIRMIKIAYSDHSPFGGLSLEYMFRQITTERPVQFEVEELPKRNPYLYPQAWRTGPGPKRLDFLHAHACTESLSVLQERKDIDVVICVRELSLPSLGGGRSDLYIEALIETETEDERVLFVHERLCALATLSMRNHSEQSLPWEKKPRPLALFQSSCTKSVHLRGGFETQERCDEERKDSREIRELVLQNVVAEWLHWEGYLKDRKERPEGIHMVFA